MIHAGGSRRIRAHFDVKTIRVVEEQLLDFSLWHFVLSVRNAVFAQQAFDRIQIVGVQRDVGIAGLNLAVIAGSRWIRLRYRVR